MPYHGRPLAWGWLGARLPWWLQQSLGSSVSQGRAWVLGLGPNKTRQARPGVMKRVKLLMPLLRLMMVFMEKLHGVFQGMLCQLSGRWQLELG